MDRFLVPFHTLGSAKVTSAESGRRFWKKRTVIEQTRGFPKFESVALRSRAPLTPSAYHLIRRGDKAITRLAGIAGFKPSTVLSFAIIRCGCIALCRCK